jgi:hypothetical protein
MESVHLTNGNDPSAFNATEIDAYDQKPTIISSEGKKENVERVKGKWGEDLNTAFPYDKYVGERAQVGPWASSAARYEWQDQFDAEAVAPRDEALEKQLFGDEGEGNMGINFVK